MGLTRSSRRRRIVLSEEYYAPPCASPVVETGLEVVLISPHESSLRRILNDCQSIVRWFRAEVLNLGGYDVLLTPFQPDEVLRVSTSAWLAWMHTLADSSPPRKPAKSESDLSNPPSEMEGALAARSGG